MTTKRDSKRKQGGAKSTKRPKLKIEKLRDLDAKEGGEKVKGGYRKPPCGCVVP